MKTTNFPNPIPTIWSRDTTNGRPSWWAPGGRFGVTELLDGRWVVLAEDASAFAEPRHNTCGSAVALVEALREAEKETARVELQAGRVIFHLETSYRTTGEIGPRPQNPLVYPLTIRERP